MERLSYYVEVFNSTTNSKGFLVQLDDGYTIAEYPMPTMVFFDTPDEAWWCVAANQIENKYSKAIVKERSALIAEGAITVISVRGWFIANDSDWKLCYNPLKNIYHFDKREEGFLVWLDKRIAERAVVKFTKHFNKMKLHIVELIPQTV